MKVQKYKVWPGDVVMDERNAVELHAVDPETAAEWFLEDNYDGATDGVELNVKAEDGTVYGVFVEVSTAPRFNGRKSS